MGKRVPLERISFLWSRLSFNHKVTIRNLFRYKKRFWMTVVGIGGCAGLIITGFGLRDAIFDVMDKQFDEIYRYTTQVSLVKKVTPGEFREVEQLLNNSNLVEGWLPCYQENVTTESAAYTVDAVLQVFTDPDEMRSFIDLRHRTNSVPVEFSDEGVVLNEKLAKLLDVQPGDTFLIDGDERFEVTVLDITEHYIQHYIYMTEGYYQKLLEKELEPNLILAQYPVDGTDVGTLERELVGLDGVSSLSRISDTRKTFTSSLSAVDYAVVLVIACAAALAFVVLYNLTNINITERMRELATLKVLGFYDRELSAYVYRENVILTVFGVALGIIMGKLLHQWLILTVEIDMLMFGREIAPISYVYSVVLTTLFSLVVNLSAHKKLKKLDMVESLKTVE
jgi:putative ABC transport system permease protein